MYHHIKTNSIPTIRPISLRLRERKCAEMASPGNRHCANCIGALSFPILTVRLVSELWQDVFKQMYAIISNKYACGSKIARPYSINKATLKIKNKR